MINNNNNYHKRAIALGWSDMTDSNENNEQSSSFVAYKALSRICAAVLAEHGIESIRLSSLHMITSALTGFVFHLGRMIKLQCEVSHRSSANLYDTVVALNTFSPGLLQNILSPFDVQRDESPENAPPHQGNSEEFVIACNTCEIIRPFSRAEKTAASSSHYQSNDISNISHWDKVGETDYSYDSNVSELRREARRRQWNYVEFPDSQERYFCNNDVGEQSKSRAHHSATTTVVDRHYHDEDDRNEATQSPFVLSSEHTPKEALAMLLPKHLPSPLPTCLLVPIKGYKYQFNMATTRKKPRRYQYDRALEDTLHVQLLLPKVMHQSCDIVDAGSIENLFNTDDTDSFKNTS